MLTDLRKWSAKTLEKHSVLNPKYITKLAKIPEIGGIRDNGRYFDFDLVVKIIQIFRVDKYTTEIRVVDDSGEMWFGQVFTAKYRKLREGQYVRIRSACLEHHDKYERTFGVKAHSNILILPYPCQLAKDIIIDSGPIIKEADQKLLEEDHIFHPIIATEIKDAALKRLPIKTLDRVVREE